jgi:hypothetical protein
LLFNCEGAHLRLDTLVLDGVYLGIAKVLNIKGFWLETQGSAGQATPTRRWFSAPRRRIQVEAEHMSAEICLSR